jgi:hypothetical protein
VYEASKENNIPPHTLQDRLLISPPAKEVPILKNWKSFEITPEDETNQVGYTTEICSAGFGLRATDNRQFVFQKRKVGGGREGERERDIPQ